LEHIGFGGGKSLVAGAAAPSRDTLKSGFLPVDLPIGGAGDGGSRSESAYPGLESEAFTVPGGLGESTEADSVLAISAAVDPLFEEPGQWPAGQCHHDHVVHGTYQRDRIGDEVEGQEDPARGQ